MGKWNLSEVSRPGFNNPLIGVVNRLSPSAKQAMYAAGQKGLIKRRTWDGCAFNAAGEEVLRDIRAQGKAAWAVSSYTRAAEVFGMSEADVLTFILRWDSLQGDDATCTQRLMEAISTVGLYSEPYTYKPSRIVGRRRYNIYQSQLDKEKEEFEALVADIDFDNVAEDSAEANLVSNAHEASNLLSLSS